VHQKAAANPVDEVDDYVLQCMIIKLKFTEPEAEVYIIRISLFCQFCVCDASIEALA